MSTDPATLAQLDELLAAIGDYDDPRRAGGEWVGMRDVAGLTELIDQLRAPEGEAAGPAGDAPSAEVCKRAMRAFRKRLALTVLDEESTLGRSPLTKGSRAAAGAIVPPTEWPDEVWQELVRQGKLRHVGHGLYERGTQQ